MPILSGRKCEECPDMIFEHDQPDPRAQPWHTIMVGQSDPNGPVVVILNPPDLEIPEHHDFGPYHMKAHYLSTAACLVSHIARLLKIDPTTLHR